MNLEEFKINVLPLQDKIYGFSCRLMGDAEEARDVVQEIYVKLWRLREKLHTYRNLEAFAMTVTRNLCLDKLRARRTVSMDGPYFPEEEDTGQQPDEMLENANAAKLARDIINDLPEQQRSVIHLRDVEGYEFEEIGEMTGMNINNVRVVLSRARKKVREELLKTYNDHENPGNRKTARKIL